MLSAIQSLLLCLKAVMKTEKAPTEPLMLAKYDKLCLVVDEIIHEVRSHLHLHLLLAEAHLLTNNAACNTFIQQLPIISSTYKPTSYEHSACRAFWTLPTPQTLLSRSR